MTKFLSALNTTSRLAILGVIAFVLMAIPTSFYVTNLLDELNKAKKEAIGLIPAGQILDLIQLTQRHRGLSKIWLSGNSAIAQKREDKQEQVDASMARLTASVESYVTDPKAAADWQTALSDWRAIKAGLERGSLTKEQSFAAHNHLIEDILNAGDRFYDEFSLSHDADAGFSHLIQTVLFITPQVTDAMGKARAIGAAALSAKSLSIADRTKLASLAKLAETAVEDAERESELLFDARPELEPLLAKDIYAAINDARAALGLTESAVLSDDQLTMSSGKYYQAFSEAIDGQFNVATVGLTGLSKILNERIDDRRDALIALSVQLSLVTALGLWLGYVIAQSITRQLGGEPREVVSIARAVAKGELTTSINTDRADPRSLAVAMSEMQLSLSDIVTSVRDSGELILSGSAEISASNQDLSRRSEQHAADLEETAAAIVEITATVKQSTEAVVQAKEMAESANAAALDGGQVVKQVHETMRAIEESAKKIHNIIGVVDEIAFQTNILALNAAVEAARAGEQGRGFAVVASEVRNLAQRSAEAAQEVRTLIVESVESVSTGSALVSKASVSTDAIVSQVKTVSELLTDISNASAEQAQGIGKIDQSMSSIDRVTQQNTAMVEESAASAEALRQEAEKLSSLVSVFKVSAMAE